MPWMCAYSMRRMARLYSLRGTVSSEKHRGSRGRANESVTVCSRATTAASTARSTTCGRLYLYDALLERWPPDLEDVAAALGPCLQGEHTIEARKTSPCRGRGPALVVRAGLRHCGTTPRWRRVYASPVAEYPSDPVVQGRTRALGRGLARRAPPRPDRPSPPLTRTVWSATLGPCSPRPVECALSCQIRLGQEKEHADDPDNP
jgi:hypothetical protein